MGSRVITAKVILLIFGLWAVFDFVWGDVKERSILAGFISVLLGLCGTAMYCFLMGGFGKIKSNPTLSAARCVSPAIAAVSALADDMICCQWQFLLITQGGVSGVGRKWLCIVVKFFEHDAFVVTAYLTDLVKKGKVLWPKES